MENKLIAIKLKFLPFYSTFRYDHTWWYHIPPSDSPENAVETTTSYHVRLKQISNETIVGARIYEVPKNVIKFGKML